MLSQLHHRSNLVQNGSIIESRLHDIPSSLSYICVLSSCVIFFPSIFLENLSCLPTSVSFHGHWSLVQQSSGFCNFPSRKRERERRGGRTLDLFWYITIQTVNETWMYTPCNIWLTHYLLAVRCRVKFQEAFFIWCIWTRHRLR